jgi:hypothetical protein
VEKLRKALKKRVPPLLKRKPERADFVKEEAHKNLDMR